MESRICRERWSTNDDRRECCYSWHLDKGSLRPFRRRRQHLLEKMDIWQGWSPSQRYRCWCTAQPPQWSEALPDPRYCPRPFLTAKQLGSLFYERQRMTKLIICVLLSFIVIIWCDVIWCDSCGCLVCPPAACEVARHRKAGRIVNTITYLVVKTTVSPDRWFRFTAAPVVTVIFMWYMFCYITCEQADLSLKYMSVSCAMYVRFVCATWVSQWADTTFVILASLPYI